MKQNMITSLAKSNVVNGFEPDFLRSHSFIATAVLPLLGGMVKAMALSSFIGAAACMVCPNALLSCLPPDEETPKTYKDTYGIFSSKVDVQALGETIKHDLRPLMSKKCHWFVIWYLLRINHCLDLEKKRIDFCKQMQEWYGKSFSLHCLDNYAATCLVNTNWHTWENEVFPDFEKNESKAIAQGRISLDTAKEMLVLCKQFDPIIEKKCFKAKRSQ